MTPSSPPIDTCSVALCEEERGMSKEELKKSVTLECESEASC